MADPVQDQDSDDHAPESIRGTQCQERLSQRHQDTIQQRLPDITEDDTTNQVRHKEDRPEYIGSLDLFSQCQCDQERHHIYDHAGQDCKQNCQPECMRKCVVQHDLRIIGKADKSYFTYRGKLTE